MSTVPDGATATVRRIDEELEAQLPRMQELERNRLIPGQRFSRVGALPGQVRLSVEGAEVTLDDSVAALVYVN
jgi:hypothetical protein